MADFLNNNHNDLLEFNHNNNPYYSNDNNYKDDYHESEDTQRKLVPGSYEYAYNFAQNAMNSQISPEETAALLIDEGYTEDQAITVVRQLLDANENNTNAEKSNTDEKELRVNEAIEIAREALLIKQLGIAQTQALLIHQGYTEDETNAAINKVSVNANAGAQQFIMEKSRISTKRWN